MDETTQLMANLHHVYTPTMKLPVDTKDLESAKKEFYEDGERLQEAIFYGSTGSFEYQLTNHIQKKYSLDKDWLKDNKAINLDDVPAFILNLKNHLHRKLNLKTTRFGRPSVNDFKLFTFSKSDLICGLKSYDAILKLLTTRLDRTANQTFQSIGDYNILTSAPFIKMPNGEYFITSTFQVSKALYETPFYWMISNKEYSSNAQHNRGQIAENIVVQQLSSVFPKESIHPNVFIKENKEKTITEIDVLVVHEEIGIIFQVKSKRLTQLSKQGNIESIKKDLNDAFGDAYHSQGLLARKLILNEQKNYFFENVTNEIIDSIKECIVVVITLDFYPAMIAQIHSLIKADEGCTPIGISIFDLENIMTLMNSQEKLLQYFYQRSKYTGNFLADNEMAMLGFYLKHKFDKKIDGFVFADVSFATNIDNILHLNQLQGIDVKAMRNSTTTKRKIGRNDACGCGSGLKYKVCHGKNTD